MIIFIIFIIFIRLLKIELGSMVYLAVLIPASISFALEVSKRRVFYFNLVDWIIFTLILLNILTMFVATARSEFSVNLIMIIYVTFPLMVYALFRLKKFTIGDYTKMMYVFTYVYALYTITEFLLYALIPESKLLISNYFKFVVENNNFGAPGIDYPIIGFNYKPWGPMFDASASGTLLVVLYSYLLDTYKGVQSRFKIYFIPISLLAIFLSGSRSAYFVLILFYVARYVILNSKNLTYYKIIVSFTAVLAGLLVMILMVNYFFSDDLLDWYLFAMIFDPLDKLFNGLHMNGFYSIIGSGQENNFYKVHGLSEVDFFNSIFRYGLLFMSLLISLLTCLAYKYRVNYPSFSLMFLMFIFSMVHYQVILKFPGSLIIFSGIAVLLNDKNRGLSGKLKILCNPPKN
jgi:hypothetical protein